MNGKQIIPLFLVLLVGGAVFYWSHRSQPGENESAPENPATVVSVQVGQLRRATLHGYVSGFGTVQPAPADVDGPAATARVAAPIAGIVKTVSVREGETVERGAPLVELDDRIARVAATNARQAAERQKKLYDEGNTSQKNLQDADAQLASAEAQLALLHGAAPLGGTVTHLNVHAGEAVDPSTVVAEIADLHRLVISADLPSADVARLRLGEPLVVAGEKNLSATVSFLSPAVDAATDTVNVKAALPPDSGLRPGAMIAVKITTDMRPDCLAAPAQSVVTDNDGHSVIALVKGGEATQVPVTVGLREGDLVEVSGAALQAGDTVVTVGAYGLPEKTRVQVEKPGVASP
jgi:membrane fusion protein (multidrug efflux system)